MKTENVNINGTCLQGYISATRSQLEHTFGGPSEWGPGDKVTTEWAIEFDDGTVATIYDWKRYEAGPPQMNEVEQWHIGGHSRTAVEKVHDAFRHALGFAAARSLTAANSQP